MSSPIVEEHHFPNKSVICIKDWMHDKKVIRIVWIIYITFLGSATMQ